jgi:hypothetical protein
MGGLQLWRAWAVQSTQNCDKENNMKEQDRVLIRRGARELTPTEADLINGGLRTLTVCTIGGATAQRDGDVSLGEC